MLSGWKAAGVLALLLVVSTLTLGCGGNPQPGGTEAAPQWVGRLEVVNRSSSDMDIFVVQDRGPRLRIGLAPNNTTTSFKISPAQVAGAGMVRFIAVPLAGGGVAVSSEPVHLSPKDSIVLDIPPP